MHSNRKIGNYGEDIATEYLSQNGYKIIQRNFFSRKGEIDIIAKDLKSKELVFIEVKSRTSHTYGAPIEAINSKKIGHMYQTARYYTYKNHLENTKIRFDAIEIYIIGKKAKVHHIPNIIIY